MIQLFSINQHSSLAEREAAFSTLISGFNEPGILLQTCNRTEFYKGEGSVPLEIAEHLFRVVSGLESSLIGEIAIQGQVRTAYSEACRKYNLSKDLHNLFQTALFVGKKVRTESGISRGAMSHSQAAVEIILQSGISLNKTIISLIGAHKLNEDIIRFLKCKGAETIFLANKTIEKARTIALKFDCRVMRLDQMHDMLQFSDIVISATAAPHIIVQYDSFPKSRKMLILDLAFPRDVDERIGQLPGIDLFNLENIENLVNQNLNKRKVEAEKAGRIIEAEIVTFHEKQQQKSYYVLNNTA